MNQTKSFYSDNQRPKVYTGYTYWIFLPMFDAQGTWVFLPKIVKFYFMLKF